MTTDKEAAAAYRVLADWNRGKGRPNAADSYAASANLLDPPKPTYADGTVAKVTYGQYLTTRIMLRVCNGWAFDVGDPAWDVSDPSVTKVEPLRVLGDDEIAIPRHHRAAIVKCLREHTSCSLAELILEEVLTALDAEAGDAK